MMPFFNKINETITKILTSYGSFVGVELNTNRGYASSTEYSDYYALGMNTGNGHVSNYTKDSYNSVRAFLRVKDSNNNIDIVR